MRNQSRVRHRRSRYRRRALSKLALLMLPALFWSAVFMLIAGARPLERGLSKVPDMEQAVVALACPVLAVMLGLAALRQHGNTRAGSMALSRVSIAAGVLLFVFAVVAALRPA